MLLWSLCFPLIRLSLNYAPLMITAFLHASIPGTLLIVIAYLSGRTLPNSLRIWIYIASIGLLSTGLGLWGMFYAGSLLSPGLATVITNTQPLIAGLLGIFYLNEHIGKSALFSLILGFTGIFIVSLNGFYSSNMRLVEGIIYLLITSTSVALGNVLLKKIAGQADIFFVTGFQLLIGSIPLGLIALHTSHNIALSWQPNYLWIIAAIAIPGTALPYVLWFWLMHKSVLHKINIYSFLTPIFGLYLGHTFFSESLTATQWVGISLIISAVAFNSI